MRRATPLSPAVLIAPPLAVAFGLAIILAPAAAGAGTAVVGFLILTDAFARFILRGDPEAAIVRRWAIGAFVAHLALGILITLIPGAVGYLGGDANTYHRFAERIVSHWVDGATLPTTLSAGKAGYGYVLAALYWLLGSSGPVGLALNASASALLIPLMHDTTRRIFGRRATPAVRLVLAIQPGFLIWTSQLLREAVILFLLAVALNAAARALTSVSPLPLVAFAGSTASLLTVRSSVGLLATAGLLLGLALSQRNAIRGLGTGIAATIGIVLAVVVLGLGLAGYQASSGTSLEDVQASRSSSARAASSGFGADVDVSEATRAIGYLPVGLVRAALGPFPWDVGGAREVPGLVETVTIWCLLPSFVRGIRRARRMAQRRVVWMLLLPALTTASGLALAVGNYGTLIRQRPQIVLFLLPLVGLGWARQRPALHAATGASLPAPRPRLAAR